MDPTIEYLFIYFRYTYDHFRFGIQNKCSIAIITCTGTTESPIITNDPSKKEEQSVNPYEGPRVSVT